MDKRTEILQAAKISFETFGYKATTMEQVAKFSKVAKGTVYNFFLNKEEILQEVVVSMIKQMITEIEETANPSFTFTENAKQTLKKLMKYRKHHMLFVKLIDEELHLQTPEVKQMLLKIEDEILTYIAGKMQIAIDKGEIRPCNTKLVSYMLLKTYLAFIVDWPTNHDEELDEDTIITLLQDTIIRGLLV